MPDQASNPVLFLDCIARTLDLPERVFEVSLLVNIIAVLINQLKGEVAEHPEERWKVRGHLIWIDLLALLHLELLREVDDQGKVLKRILVDAPNTVVHEHRAKQEGEEKDLSVMVLLFVEGT